MSRARKRAMIAQRSFPRVSGDEPRINPAKLHERPFSPRERG